MAKKVVHRKVLNHSKRKDLEAYKFVHYMKKHANTYKNTNNPKKTLVLGTRRPREFKMNTDYIGIPRPEKSSRKKGK